NYDGLGGNSTNQLYARELAGYVYNLKNTYGINLYAISIQNEPDISTSYASCVWTQHQFHDFVTNLYPAMVASNVASTLIMLPEDYQWEDGYYFTTMIDTNVAPDVGIIACHNYYGGNAVIPNFGKPLWETEVSTIGGTYDGSIGNALGWAQRIHEFLTVPQVNAWHYWWLISLNPDNEGLTDNNWVPAKRMYVLGQWSRFVRPNYYRINVANGSSHPLVTAFKDS